MRFNHLGKDTIPFLPPDFRSDYPESSGLAGLNRRGYEADGQRRTQEVGSGQEIYHGRIQLLRQVVRALSRCLNFAMSDERSGDPETYDIKNQAFWAKLTATFQATLELLKEMVEEEGIDFGSLGGDEPDEKRLDEEILSNHPCCRGVQIYSKMADEWFNSQSHLFDEPESDLELGAGSLDQATDLGEVTDVIRWYQNVIYAKLMRAVSGKLHEEPDLLDEFSKDSDGSAKVALIGIDRSIGAWGEI